MGTKSFFKLLITLIVTFGLTAMCAFVAFVCTSGGSFFGYEFNSADETTHINAMLLGLDKGGTRTDVMILGQLNLVDNEINMLQIPRDSYVANNGRGDRKINSAYGYNKEKTVFKEIKQLTGLNVDKYVIVDTSGFRDLIDTIGGVDFEVPQNMDYDDPDQDLYIHLKAGYQHLDGDKAEQLVRFRSYPDGDIGRMRVQSAFIQATIDELFSLANVFKINDLVEDFSKIVDTNFTMNEMLTYAPYVFATDRESIMTHQLAGDAKYMGGVSYVMPNSAENEKLVEEYFTPSTLSETKSAKELSEHIIGTGSVEKPVSQGEVKKSFFNRFTSVDIIDASGDTAHCNELITALKDYGYNVRTSVVSSKADLDKTYVVSKTISVRASDVARLTGNNLYIYNPIKESGSDITIIIGKDYEE
ncbi:MAG: LCP family protein [Clostridia bacterium]|nr:LCP family protein [Clostridia bacterium]